MIEVLTERFDRVCEIHDYVNEKPLIEDDISSDDGYYGLSPPPPYTKEDLVEYEDDEDNRRRSFISSCPSPVEANPTIEYNDVGEEIVASIPVSPKEEIGLTILSAKSLTPCWPVILDIKKASPAWRASPELKIGDQIKEIDGIPTENLKYSQILNLFTKATDILHVVLRRGMEPTKRAFDWFRFPFLSVGKTTDKITISSTSNLRKLYDEEFVRKESENLLMMTSFRRKEEHFTTASSSTFLKETTTSLPRFKDREISVAKKDGGRISHCRSLFASASNRSMFLWRDRQHRRTVQESAMATSEDLSQRKFASSSTTSLKNINSNGRSIFNEVEIRRLRSDSRASSGLGDMSRKSSQSSLASSTSTISSFASSTHIEQQDGATFEHASSSSSIAESAESSTRYHPLPKDITSSAPANKLRDSFRIKKIMTMKQSNNNSGKTNGKSLENTLNVTLWIPDRRKLGVKLGGGCVSPYGDSNISVMEVKRTGTAYKVLRPGDELLEMDGKLTSGMDVFQVNNILKQLEGNYVEFKIFRPTKL